MADGTGLTVLVTFRARAEDVDEVVAEIIRNSRDSTSEPGCDEFLVLRDADDPLEFALYERYRDDVAFHQEHMGTGHYARWKAVAERCLEPGSQRRREWRSLTEGRR